MSKRVLLKSIAMTALAALATAGATHAAADDYPSRAVRLVVPWTAGGGADVIARLIGAKLSMAWGQSVYVDNKAGALGTIGTDLVAKAPPDGYTLLLGNNSTYVMAVGMMKLPYAADRDLLPISRIAEVPHVLAVNTAVPVKNLQELIALARKQPGSMTFASSGSGSTPHVAGELFMKVTDTRMLHVPYRGASQAVADTVAGNVQVSFDTVPAVLPFIQGEKLRPLAILGSKRIPTLPDVPTTAEAGANGAEGVTWYGLYGPAKLPDAIVRKLHDEVARIVQMPDIKARLEAMGAMDTSAMPPEVFAASVQDEIRRYADVLKDLKKE